MNKPFLNILKSCFGRQLFIYFLFFFFVSVQAQNTMPPPNRKMDGSLKRFVSELEDDAKNKNWVSFVKKLDRNVVNGFNVESGIHSFRNTWEDSPVFWPLLERMISQGGSRVNEYKYVFPYIAEEWPGNLEKGEHGIICGNRVNIREEASVQSSKTTQLSYELVRVNLERSSFELGPHSTLKNNPLEPFNWYYIETIDGEKCGYVYWEYFLSPDRYRLIVEQSNGTWLITAFIFQG